MLARLAIFFSTLLTASCLDDTAALSGGAAPRPIPTTPPNPPAAAGQGGAAGAVEPGDESSAGAAGAGGDGSSAGAGTVEQCHPAPEICNGEDDDCNGVSDDGCPLALAWTTSTVEPAIGDSPGGSVFADSCAKDELLVGLEVATGAWVDQVSGVCRKFALKPDTETTPYQYSFCFLETRALAAHPPETSSETHELLCDDGQALVGLRISEQNYVVDGVVQYVVIPSLWILCAEPVLDLDAAEPKLGWQDAVEVGPAAGSFADGTAWFAEHHLTSPAFAVTLHGSAGNWIDRVGLGSSAIVASFR